MKIYPNDPCPCGSGKKYKKCCLNKATSQTKKNTEFIVNPRSAVVFKDISKQPVLELLEGTTVKKVLSVGLFGLGKNQKPMATIQDDE